MELRINGWEGGMKKCILVGYWGGMAKMNAEDKWMSQGKQI